MALSAIVAILICASPAAAQFGYWSHPEAIAVAPDDRHVYVGSNDGLLALARDTASGALTQVGRFSGTYGPLEISPDGTSVYAGRARFQTASPLVSAFERDPASGALRPVTVSGWRTSGGVNDIAVSPDGATVYATDVSADELAILARHSDGSLSFVASAPHPPGVIELRGMAISSDGRWLYAAGRVSESGGRVVRYERLPGGALAIAQVVDCGPCFGDSVVLSPAGWLYVGTSGLVALRWDPETGELGEPGSGTMISSGGGEPGGSNLAIAGDGVLYVADGWGHRVYQLRPVTDGYELVRSYREFQDGARGLEHLRSIAIAPDGRHVYVAAGVNSPEKPGTVATFSRDPSSGDLSFASLFTGGTSMPPLAVTINGGDEYTDDRRVRVTVSGGFPALQLELANDGGFVDGRLFTFASDGSYPWTLASTGPDRLPKTVYARPAWEPGPREGGPWRGQPVHDTIVLDETRPVVLTARRVRAPRLRVRARDRLSGVKRVQIARNRGAPGRWRPYRARRLYPVARGQVWVRAGDRAGNRSRWRAVRGAGSSR